MTWLLLIGLGVVIGIFGVWLLVVTTTTYH